MDLAFWLFQASNWSWRIAVLLLILSGVVTVAKTRTLHSLFFAAAGMFSVAGLIIHRLAAPAFTLQDLQGEKIWTAEYIQPWESVSKMMMIAGALCASAGALVLIKHVCKASPSH